MLPRMFLLAIQSQSECADLGGGARKSNQEVEYCAAEWAHGGTSYCSYQSE
jgi:hypothetical protein